MKFKVGDLVKWDGHDARIGAIMQHPPRYIIEYTVRQSDVSGTISHTYNRTKNVKEDELTPDDNPTYSYRDLDTSFNATLRRIKIACDVIEDGVPFERENHYDLGTPQGGYGFLTLEEAVADGLELTGDEVQAHDFLVLRNGATQVIAIFHDGRAFLPNELMGVQS